MNPTCRPNSELYVLAVLGSASSEQIGHNLLSVGLESAALYRKHCLALAQRLWDTTAMPEWGRGSWRQGTTVVDPDG